MYFSTFPGVLLPNLNKYALKTDLQNYAAYDSCPVVLGAGASVNSANCADGIAIGNNSVIDVASQGVVIGKNAGLRYQSGIGGARGVALGNSSLVKGFGIAVGEGAQVRTGSNSTSMGIVIGNGRAGYLSYIIGRVPNSNYHNYVMILGNYGGFVSDYMLVLATPKSDWMDMTFSVSELRGMMMIGNICMKLDIDSMGLVQGSGLLPVNIKKRGNLNIWYDAATSELVFRYCHQDNAYKEGRIQLV